MTDQPTEVLRKAMRAIAEVAPPPPSLPAAASPQTSRKRSPVLIVAGAFAITLLVGAFLLSLSGNSDPGEQVAAPGGAPARQADVIIWMTDVLGGEPLAEFANEVLSWDHVVFAEPWNQALTLAEFNEMFSDLPEILAVVAEDPTVLPMSVRVWTDTPEAATTIASRAEDLGLNAEIPPTPQPAAEDALVLPDPILSAPFDSPRVIQAGAELPWEAGTFTSSYYELHGDIVLLVTGTGLGESDELCGDVWILNGDQGYIVPWSTPDAVCAEGSVATVIEATVCPDYLAIPSGVGVVDVYGPDPAVAQVPTRLKARLFDTLGGNPGVSLDTAPGVRPGGDGASAFVAIDDPIWDCGYGD